MFNFFKVQKVEEKKVIKKEPEDFHNIDPIAKYVKENIGIDFDNQKAILKSRVTTICRTHHIYSFQNCLEEIKNNKDFKQDVINYLTTNESFFYREFNQIQDLVKKVKASSSSVSILCAPCATGEEPYSIAMALLEEGVSAHNFSITGIDISSNAIEKSLEGIYNENTVRNLSQSIRETYFVKQDDTYKINREIKSKVQFKCVNIFEKEFDALGKFDYIFSRNMLIYFDEQTKKKAQDAFKTHLKNQDEPIFYGHADFPSLKRS